MSEYRLAIVIDGEGRAAVSAFDQTTGAVIGLEQALAKLNAQSKKTGDGAGGAAEAVEKKWSKAGVAVGAAVTGAVVALTAMTARAIQQADALEDLSERLGVTTEFLSAMGYAARSSGASAAVFEQAMGSLAQTLTRAADGQRRQSALFQALGVDVVDAQGKTRGLDVVLGDLADRFSRFEDGPRKAAIATQLFGSAGQQLIPMLNRGSAGLAELTAQAERLGLVISSDTAADAAAFGDALQLLMDIAMGMTNQFAAELLPTLESLAAQIGNVGTESRQAQTTGVSVLADGLKSLAGLAVLTKNAIEGLVNVTAGAKDALAEAATGWLDSAREATSRHWSSIRELFKGNIRDAIREQGAMFDAASGAIERSGRRADDAWANGVAGWRQQVDEFARYLETAWGPRVAAATGPARNGAGPRIGGAGDEAAQRRMLADLRREQAALEREYRAELMETERAERQQYELEAEMIELRQRMDLEIQELLGTYERERQLIGMSDDERREAIVQMQAEAQVRQLVAEYAREGIRLSEQQVQALVAEAQARALANEQLARQRDFKEALRRAGGRYGGEVRAGELIPYRQITDLLAAAVRDGFRGGLPDFLKTLSDGVRRAFSKENILGTVNEALSFASDYMASRREGRDSVGSLLNAGVNAAASSDIPVVREIAQAVRLVDSIFGGRLLGTGWQPSQSGRNVSFGPGGFSGQDFEEQVRQRSLFRGRQWSTNYSDLDAQVEQQLAEVFNAISASVAAGVRLLSVDTPRVIEGIYREIRDAQGNITLQRSTVRGVDYDEDMTAYARRLVAENLIEVIRQAAGDASDIAQRWRQSADALLGGAQFLLRAQQDIQRATGLLDGDNALRRTTDLVESLRAGDETLDQAYSRVLAASRLFDEALELAGISLGGTREEIVRFAADVAEATGSIERAAGLWQRYVETFYTADERAQRQLELASGRRDTQAAALGINPGISLAEFRAQFEAALPTLSAEQIAAWLEFANTLADVDAATRALAESLAEQAEAARIAAEEAAEIARQQAEAAAELARRQAEAAAELASFIADIEREVGLFGASDFEREMRRIRDAQAEATTTANDLARAAGRAGASERELALIHRWAANQVAAAIRQLQANVQRLVDELGYGALTTLEQQIAALEAAQRGLTETQLGGIAEVRDATDGLYQAQVSALQSLRDSLQDDLLGDLSPLSPEDQIAEARRQLEQAAALAERGDADAMRRFTELRRQFLQMMRGAEASGADYAEQYGWVQGLAERILRFQPIGGGSGGGGGYGGSVQLTPSQELLDLYAQRDAMVAQQEAERRLGLAMELAQNLRDLAGQSRTTIFEAIERAGVDLARFVTDLGGDAEASTAATVAALAGVSNVLDVELADLAARLGLELGRLADDQSLINDALELVIAGLPAEFRDQLTPALNDLETAADATETAAALQRLVDLSNALPDEFRAQLAPYFDEVDPYMEQQLGELDYLEPIQDHTASTVVNTAETVVLLQEILTYMQEWDPNGPGTPLGPVGPAAAGAAANIGMSTVAANDAVLVELRGLRTDMAALRAAIAASADKTSGAVAEGVHRQARSIEDGLNSLASSLASQSRTAWSR